MLLSAAVQGLVWTFPLNLPQVGNLECNNMASTNECRLTQQEFCQPIHCNRVDL